ncbi:MAG: hypothetical protein LUD74_01970 [Tannerellaceae bacterium]|nr:hypothetical protein [Tannerellaceae bacterium]
MENRDKVINNLKFRYQLVEKINRLEKIYQRLVNNLQKRESERSDFYNKYTAAQLLSDTERVRKLSLTFHEIGLHYSLRRLLVSNGIETITDLLRVLRDCGPEHLLTFKNFGKRSLKTLKERLVLADLIDDNFGSEYYDSID